MRTFAIINTHDVDISNNIISKLDSHDDIYVFQVKDIEFQHGDNVKIVKIPQDISESGSKMKNFVSRYFFDMKYNGFLHSIEDNVQIYSDPSNFMVELEKMMSKLNLKTWLNTATDVCNYTFNIYNPRCSIEIDEPECKNLYDKTIYFTSHANTSWMCYDYSKVTMKDVEFDENFTIPMYYIIKFLAERRNKKNEGEMYYMNYYPTVKEELGVFKNIQINEENPIKQEMFGTEGEIFKSMNINHSPDVDISILMKDILGVLKENR